MLTIELSKSLFVKKQLPALSLRKPPVTLLYGGAGSGKSYSLAQFDVIDLLRTADLNRARGQHARMTRLIIRKVFRTHRHSTFAEIMGIIREWQLDSLFEINKSDLSIICKVNGNKLLFFGMDNADKLLSVSGATSARIEEATEITQDDYGIIASRLRTPGARNNVVMSFNPKSSIHWIKKKFFDAPDAHKYKKIHTTFRDNPFLPPDYGERLLEIGGKSGNFYKVFYLGEFGSLEDLIYYDYREPLPGEENVLDYENPIRQQVLGIHQGVDFGFNHPTVFVKAARTKDTIYILDALFLRQKVTPELIKEARKFFFSDMPIYADSADPEKIQQFRINGLDAHPAKKKGGSVKDGIDFIQRHTLVVPRHLVEVWNELQSYSYKRDPRTGELLDEPIKAFDHFSDALRYALMPVIYRRQARAVKRF